MTEKVKNNIVYLMLSKPNVYLQKLIMKTLVIGALVFGIGLFIKYFKLNYTIPISTHTLISVVIGMLLVFRVNSAYDRWWDGRKIISNLSTQIGLISTRLNVINHTNIECCKELKHDCMNKLRLAVNSFLNTLCLYLVSGKDGEESIAFHMEQTRLIEECLLELSYFDKDDHNVKSIGDSLDKILEYSNNLERIKNTPIPLSYVFHIKVSIFIYLVSLPFGMFHELGLWATPLVMLIYYIIAGVEIISNEIENPFADDPNDLPTEQLFQVMINTLKINN